jgi:RNA polymerase sigma-70 factor (ECF subfamily)
MTTMMELTMAHDGDEQADFEVFFVTFGREIAAVVALTTGDPGLAEDATQEAMTRAHARWTRVSTLDRPDLWVMRVATRIAVDGWRRRRRETGLDDPPSSQTNTEIQRLWVRWGLEQLTHQERVLIILRHRDGLSVEEVATLQGMSPHTIAIYLKRARRRLRDLLLPERDA